MKNGYSVLEIAYTSKMLLGACSLKSNDSISEFQITLLFEELKNSLIEVRCVQQVTVHVLAGYDVD